MLNNPKEYEKMAEAEVGHWWYKTLHHLVLTSIHKNTQGLDIKILDAGCGTGGNLQYLRDNGYKNGCGFDLSSHAVSYCKSKGLDVNEGDLLNIDEYYEPNSFDVIIACDNLYFLDREDIPSFMFSCKKLLKKNGIIIVNLPALKAFRGTHDISVGIKERFAEADLENYFQISSLKLVTKTYWPFLLSPLIFFVRFKQRLGLDFNKDNNEISSDVETPNKYINFFLQKLSLLSLYFKIDWGSSLFVVYRKD